MHGWIQKVCLAARSRQWEGGTSPNWERVCEGLGLLSEKMNLLAMACFGEF